MKEKIQNIFKWVKNLGTIPKIVLISVCSIVFIVLVFVIWYNTSISSKSSNASNIIVNIDIGSGTTKIADILDKSDVISNSLSFKLYCKFNKVSGLQAGTYSLNQSMDYGEIVEELKKGVVYSKDNFNITFIEGKNMRWIVSKIAKETNNTQDAVYAVLDDTKYLDSLIEHYWFIDESIKNENLYYSLEGYLFPDTYNLENKDVEIKDIFKVMLDKTEKVLNKYKESIQNGKYSAHEILTMASLIEAEGINESDKKSISSVFYNRLNSNMSLGSDVTTYYAAKIDLGERDLYQKELDAYNPYNTRGPKMAGKLPIGPICSVSQASIEAAIYPDNKDYLFFVADKNGKVYFTKTSSEHSEIIKEIKANGNWIEFK